MKGGYYGFPSKKAHQDYYSDPKNYADEIPAMEAYAKENEHVASETYVAVYLREIDAGTDNACWVVCAKGDPGAIEFVPRY